MSKSRLEKFLYALYSLDSSDLPNPLSRIEELYKCLVTGDEAPTFEPLSRVEKYLMAILGVYDVSELPNPISRVEVLLYKLAIGDNNLDDVKSFLSEHEELLAEIIRNGGVGGNIDIEYVLYALSTESNTLYNTAEKPVKSASLKGNTEYKSVDWITNFNYKKGVDVTSGTVSFKEMNDRCLSFININENRSFIFKSSTLDIAIVTTDKNNNVIKDYLYVVTTNDEVRFTVEDNCKILYLIFRKRNLTNFTSESEVINSELTVKEQNLVSVQMPILTTTGKNLFDKSTITEGKEFSGDKIINSEGSFIGDFIKVRPNTAYTMSGKTAGSRVHIFDKDKKLIYHPKAENDVIITPNDDRICYMKINGIIEEIDTWQLEEGTQATPYESFKSNILTVNEEVELRGIGEVKDELDCLTGEVIERIGEVVLDGSSDEEYIQSDLLLNNTIPFGIVLYDIKPEGASINNKFITTTDNNRDYEHSYSSTHRGKNLVWFFINKGKLSSFDVSGFRQWLSQNPLTIQYELTTESVKTVDLSVVDQDGNNTKLTTFNDITHVTLSSEGLIPEAELEVEVEEKVTEIAASMLTISHDQEVIDTATNKQSENADATMLATTEIYEGLL